MAQDKNYLKQRFARTGAEPTAEDFGTLIDSIPDETDSDLVAGQAAEILKGDPAFIKQVSPKTTNTLDAPNQDTLLTTLGTKNALQQLSDDYNGKINIVSAQASTSIVGIADPTTVPVVTTGIFRKYSVKTPGTYENFLDLNGAPIVVIDDDPANEIVGDLSKGIVELWGQNNVWSKNITLISLQAYAKNGGSPKTVLDLDNTKAEKAEVQEPIGIADQKFDKVDDIYTKTGESFNKSVYAASYNNPVGFNGWDTPVGVQNNFNLSRLYFATQAVAPTEIWVKITKISKNGVVLAEKHLTDLALPANSNISFEAMFDEIIKNADNAQLRLMFVCNQNITRYGHEVSSLPYNNVDYAFASYRSDGTLNWAFTDVTASGTANYANYAEFYLVKSGYKANQSLVDDVKQGIVGLNNLSETTGKVSGALAFDMQVDGESTVTNPNTTFNTSTFNGFGSLIGRPENFNCVQFNLISRAANTANISKAWWELRKGSSSGELVENGLIPEDIAPGASKLEIALFQETYENAELEAYWFGVRADQLLNDWGKDSGVPDYAGGAYVTSSTIPNPGGWQVNTHTNWNMWVKVGLYTQKIKPTDDFQAAIEKSLPPSNAAKAEIILAKYVYALEGYETNTYWDNVIKSNYPVNQLNIDVTCTKGAQLERGFRVTPSASDVGEVPLIHTVAKDGFLLTTYSGILKIAAKEAGSGKTIHAVNIGDSLRAGQQDQRIIFAQQGIDELSIIFKGTIGSVPGDKNEGRGGWRMLDYATIGRILYKFPLAGITVNPGIGSVYTTNGSSFSVAEVNTTDGAGYISCTKTSGANNPLTNGVLVKFSGVGDDNLNFTGSSITSANPFWDGTKINFANYLTANGITLTGDKNVISMQIGPNDVFGFTDDDSLKLYIDTMVTQLRAFMASAREAVPDSIFAIMTPMSPCISQTAMAINYSNGQTLDRYHLNIQTWYQRILVEFDSDAERALNNFVVCYHDVNDRTWNFPHTLVNANSRNSVDKAFKYTNALHSDQSGYDQPGDRLYAFYKSLF